MKQLFKEPLSLFALLLSICSSSALSQTAYFPPAGDWQRRAPEEVGMDPLRLQAAIELAQQNTIVEPKDLSLFIENSFGSEPHFSIIGPVTPRKEGSGLIIKNGFIVAEWGDTDRVDMTFSVTKSYLSIVAGLAEDSGLIDDDGDRVKDYFPHESFNDPHNSAITWRHFLTQSSEWQGTLWGKPDWADRPISRDPEIAKTRELRTPGTYYKYNDVRVNMLAYALTHVWQQSLEAVLREKIMNPINASDNWSWNGYDNSWIEINGEQVNSVSGGGHWGGGLFISTMDHARFGYLMLRNGNWAGEQLISENWIRKLRRPSQSSGYYGYLWRRNFNNTVVPNAPTNIFYATGAGGNYIWVDQHNDLLIVLRWVGRNMPEVVGAITDAVL